jgi:hypothetical protein
MGNGSEMFVHVRYMSSEVEPCVVWALRVSHPFLANWGETVRPSLLLAEPSSSLLLS